MDKFSRLKEAILAGRIITSSRDLEIADDEGWTIAHVAAMHNRLPPNFDQWDLADHEGWTVAHVAADAGTLPLHCKQDPKILDLVAAHGVTVEKLIHKKVSQKIEECRGILAKPRTGHAS